MMMTMRSMSRPADSCQFTALLTVVDCQTLHNSTYISYDWTSQKVISLYVPHRQWTVNSTESCWTLLHQFRLAMSWHSVTLWHDWFCFTYLYILCLFPAYSPSFMFPFWVLGVYCCYELIKVILVGTLSFLNIRKSMIMTFNKILMPRA